MENIFKKMMHYAGTYYMNSRTNQVERRRGKHFLKEWTLEELECPICREYCSPPIYQCVVGHISCQKCHRFSATCPLCSGAKSTTRALALEKIYEEIEIPCWYRHEGCEVVTIGYSIKTHEKYCKYREIVCPFLKNSNCTWHGKKFNEVQHFKEKHPERFFEGFKVAITARKFAQLYKNKEEYVIISAYGELFKLTWRFDNKLGMMSWCMKYLGEPRYQTKYVYVVTFGDDPDSRSFKGRMGTEEKQEGRHCRKCMFTHFSEVNIFCQANGDLTYFVKISDTNTEDATFDSSEDEEINNIFQNADEQDSFNF